MRQKGLGLPCAVASLIANFIAGKQAVAVETNQDEPFPVLQEVQHDDPVPQIDEEVAHVAIQLEADEAWAQQVEVRIVEGEIREDDSDAVVDDLWMEMDTSETLSLPDAWCEGAKGRPSDFGERVHILGFTRSGAPLM